jgi:large subunit ribosomal protein L31
MKKAIHPEYRFVVFRDVSCNVEFLTRSCMEARDTTTFEGTEYPLVSIDVSSASHPFYTGTQKMLDREGRVERFRRKYGFAGEAAPDAAPEGE